jgi:hypothetical protein
MNIITNIINRKLAEIKTRVLQGAGTDQYRERLEKARAGKIRDHCERIGVPENIWPLLSEGVGQSGERWRDTESLQRLYGLVAAGKRMLALSGPPGTGKTVAASRWLIDPDQRLTHNGASGRFRSVLDCFDQYGRCDGWGNAWIAFVLDEVGAEPEKRVDEVDRMLQDRYRNNCFTIITTNLSPGDFSQRYDPRTMSRLREIGAFVTVQQVVRPGC